ncbi:hypothetical protein HPP92_019726 [Vanilla planifolia]|uniref:RING-type E3 ubiquitin transferase n=1 Tax=Vanilla planifolia TaxID=51239 RepID=A0A835UJ68_VANPL|nr:hypothetical protein HPP92_019726 [Vanilla planifolia]
MSETNRPNMWNHWIPDPSLNWGTITVGETSSMTNPIMQSSNTFFPCVPNSSDPHIYHPFETRRELVPPNYAHNGSSYNQLSHRGLPSSTNPQNGHERSSFKRKSYAHLNSNEYHCARSSNGLSISSNQCPSLNHMGSQRNVRSRLGHSIHLENSFSPQASEGFSRHFPRTASTVNYIPMFQPSGSVFPHEINQPSGSNGRLTSSRYYPRLSYHDTASRYSTDERRFASEAYQRQPSMIRSLSHRTSSFPNDVYAHSRWAMEEATTVGRYDTPFIFDQHRDMRLDVDSMSYEELLALGERIGNVSTGLSEDNIARCLCLTRLSWCQKQDEEEEERTCVICLEEYEDGQSIGMLGCRHEFHGSCIKKWLHIKNSCPVCKAAALGDTAKGKQVLLS